MKDEQTVDFEYKDCRVAIAPRNDVKQIAIEFMAYGFHMISPRRHEDTE